MSAFLLALTLVFVAELGDKSQLLVLAFAARYRARVVIPAIFLATALIHLLSVTLGEGVSRLVPLHWIEIASGVAFILFGLWTLRPEDEHGVEQKAGGRFGAFATVAFTFFLSELGDKTMLTAITVSSREQAFLAVWAGSTLGMFAADALALVIGRVMGRQLPERAIRTGAALVFIATGIFTLIRAFR